MNKVTIELNRDKGHWSGWGRMFEKYDNPDSIFILDKLTEWSRNNPSYKIYRHVLKRAEENKNSEPTFVNTSLSNNHKVFKCDLVDYMDIYYQ